MTELDTMDEQTAPAGASSDLPHGGHDSRKLLKVSVVVPCYNEEHSIEDTVKQLTGSFPADESYEILVVNDGSSDATAQVLSDLTGRFPRLRVVTHQRNRGYGAALKTGIRQAAAPLIAIIDADGTYPNERLPELVDRCRTRDMVVGARMGANVTYSQVRAFPKIFLRAWVSWLSGRPVPDINSGMRVFRRDLAEQFLGILPDSFSFTITITLAMLTNYRDVEFVPISYAARVGKSKIKPFRDTMRFLMLILRTGTYFAPLRAFAPIILLLLTASVISLLYDLFVIADMTDKTVLLFLFTLNTGMFTLLADMIDKRSAK
jgi:glycosyltransferase involved in cell wall biosynthesis